MGRGGRRDRRALRRSGPPGPQLHGTTGTADGPGAPRGVRGPHLGPGGIESDRTDLPLLRDLVASMTSVNLEIIAGADHRLQDAAGRTMTEAVLMKVDAWLHLRKAQRGA